MEKGDSEKRCRSRSFTPRPVKGKGRPRPSQDIPRTLPESPKRPKRLFRSTWPKTFFRKIRKKNNPVFFPKELFVQRSSGKSKKHEIVDKKLKKEPTKVIHSGYLNRSSQKTRTLSKRSNPRGWRRWSREALLQSAAPGAARHGVL